MLEELQCDPESPPWILTLQAEQYRKFIEPYFAPDTAAGGWQDDAIPSAGHCAALSAIIYHDLVDFVRDLEGRILCASAVVNGGSHWFNRFEILGEAWDVDLTGDQFGLPPVQVAKAGSLYEGTRVREFSELNEETLQRAALLAERAGIEVPFAKMQNQGGVRR